MFGNLRICVPITVLIWGLATSVAAFDFKLTATPPALAEKLESASAVASLRDQDDLVAMDILAAARSDYRRLLAVLYDEAHYSAAINILLDGREAAGISLLRAPSAYETVEIRVDAGAPFTFSRADIRPLATGTSPAEGFAIGQRAGTKVVRKAAQSAISDWRDAGHAKADVAEQSITANHPNASLNVAIRIAPGPELTFGALNVPDTGRMRPSRIREIAGLPTGEVFSPAELEAAAQRLRRTGVFRSVVLAEGAQVNADQSLDINAELTESKPRRIGFGGEIGTVEGLSLSGFWLHRNLLGGAERLRFDAEVSGINAAGSEIDYAVSVRFDRPATFTPDTAFFIETKLSREDEPGYLSDSFRIESGLTHIFDDRLSGEAAVAYQYSDVTDMLGTRQLAFLQLPVGLTYDTRDDPLNATSGLFVDGDIMPFYEMRSGSNGVRLYSDLRTYLTPARRDGITTALRLQLGTVVGGSLADIAPDMLFFSGGAGTVRGQGYQSLAVDMGGGVIVGGRSFLGASAELRARVSGSWSVVAFYDAGFISDDSFGAGTGDWHFGAGLGARYDTGIGPIRLDLATPVGGSSGNNLEFYIGIGQAF